MHVSCKDSALGNGKKEVGDTGLEPVTSCMSSKHSKPTELIALELSELLIITKR